MDEQKKSEEYLEGYRDAQDDFRAAIHRILVETPYGEVIRRYGSIYHALLRELIDVIEF